MHFNMLKLQIKSSWGIDRIAGVLLAHFTRAQCCPSVASASWGLLWPAGWWCLVMLVSGTWGLLSFLTSACLSSLPEARLIKTQRQMLGFSLKVRKTKTDSHWLLPCAQSKMVILPLGISEWDCEWSPPILHSSLELGLKACATRFLWQTSVATWD